MKKLLTLLLLLPTLVFAGVETVDLDDESLVIFNKAADVGSSKTKTIELNSRNTISFNQAFDDMFVAKKQLEAITTCGKNLGGDIYIVLYTPGGSISAGQLFYDTLNALPCNFHTITIFSASMGYQTVQNLGKRYILPSGTLMSHRASISGLSGELGGELESIIKLLTKNVTEMELVASKRVGITLKQYQTEIRDELWMTADQAVSKNHADEAVLVKCDKSLLGSTFQTVNTFFGSLKVEYSNCPIIVAPLSVAAANEKAIVEFRKYLSNIKKHVNTTL